MTINGINIWQKLWDVWQAEQKDKQQKQQATTEVPMTSSCTHEYVNVGFYTSTYACKHCGCDQKNGKRKVILTELQPGDKVRYVYNETDGSSVIPSGSIFYVKHWQSDWLIFDVPSVAETMAFHRDDQSCVDQYLEHFDVQ